MKYIKTFESNEEKYVIYGDDADSRLETIYVGVNSDPYSYKKISIFLIK